MESDVVHYDEPTSRPPGPVRESGGPTTGKPGPGDLDRFRPRDLGPVSTRTSAIG
jgi:hypothetical protein